MKIDNKEIQEKYDKLISQIRKKIKRKYDIDLNNFDMLDLEEIIDIDMSVDYNIRLILEKLKAYDPDLSNDLILEEKEKYKAWQKDYEREYENKIFEQRIKEIEENNIMELDQYYQNYKQHIKAFVENDKIKGMVIVGDAGIGKTYNLIKYLNEMNKKFVLKSGHISPLGLYKFLYENNDKLIVLNDVDIFNSQIFNVLIQALDTTTNLVNWINTERQELNVMSFEFKGKIIIVTNKTDYDNDVFRALKDRCLVYDLEFGNNTILEMARILYKKYGYNTKILDWIKEISEKHNIKLSLRTMLKLYNYSQFENGKDLIEDVLLFENENIYRIIKELMWKYDRVSDQIKEFREMTGLSRATFFRYKKKFTQITKSLKVSPKINTNKEVNLEINDKKLLDKSKELLDKSQKSAKKVSTKSQLVSR